MAERIHELENLSEEGLLSKLAEAEKDVRRVGENNIKLFDEKERALKDARDYSKSYMEVDSEYTEHKKQTTLLQEAYEK